MPNDNKANLDPARKRKADYLRKVASGAIAFPTASAMGTGEEMGMEARMRPDLPGMKDIARDFTPTPQTQDELKMMRLEQGLSGAEELAPMMTPKQQADLQKALEERAARTAKR